MVDFTPPPPPPTLLLVKLLQRCRQHTSVINLANLKAFPVRQLGIESEKVMYLICLWTPCSFCTAYSSYNAEL